MNKPTAPKKEYEVEECYDVSDCTFDCILSTYSSITKDYPYVISSNVKLHGDMGDYYLTVTVIKQNNNYESHMRSYNNQMKDYNDYVEKEKLKREAIEKANKLKIESQFSKKEIKDRREAVRIADQFVEENKTSIVVFNNKTYKVSLIED